jgi:acetyl-CoA synthetase
MEHSAVAEAGAYGVPDPLAGSLVHAVVALQEGYEPSDELALDIMGHARKTLGAAVAPRWIGFTDDIPKTKSGKILRRMLRARELGLPEGDTSTLERSQGDEGDES